MINKWEEKTGMEFVNRVGIKPEAIVLDFGCGEGLFSIPIAKHLAPRGRVFAMDIDRSNLETLEKKARELSLNNIEPVYSEDDLNIKFEDDFFDIILIYDVLHLFDKEQRDKLFDNFHRILKDGGRLSVYPKHTADNFPMHELRHTYVDEVVKEIECHKFLLDVRLKTKILHNERIQEDDIYNFKKI